MTKWGVVWVAGSENKEHGKLASLFAQPYIISPPECDTWRFRRRRRSYWCSRELSMSTRDASKATRPLVKKYRRSKSMLEA
jgi:hypothetical protein